MMQQIREVAGEDAICKVAITGIKSIRDRLEIELRPLTILAGPNSSGKSSMMQGVLLLKQTLEAPYDPGPLLIRGPNVAFTSADQLLFQGPRRRIADTFAIYISTDGGRSIDLRFRARTGNADGPFELVSEKVSDGHDEIVLDVGISKRELLRIFHSENKNRAFYNAYRDVNNDIKLHRERCFFYASLDFDRRLGPGSKLNMIYRVNQSLVSSIEGIIHLPGLRGNPERTYPLNAISKRFSGTFQYYTASIIARWAVGSDKRLKQLGGQLNKLGLTWKVEARQLDDTQVELRVGRLPKPKKGGTADLVSIADVGLGVSQTLPVLVSLLVARPGQVVYIEQPEIHLHPRAQFKLAESLVEAANRGVRAVIETHSSLLLMGVQSLVAEGKLSPDKVKLHWFDRNKTTGATSIRSADLDEAGRFGDWPEDFGDVALEAESRYLDAAEARIAETS